MQSTHDPHVPGMGLIHTENRMNSYPQSSRALHGHITMWVEPHLVNTIQRYNPHIHVISRNC